MALRAFIRRLRHDQSGATATEYALLIGLIAFISVTAWDGIGRSLRRIFETITAAL